VGALPEYTDTATRNSVRPRSSLSQIASVVNLVHDALGVPSPARVHLYARLRKALRLTRTTQLVQKGRPVPPELLVALFRRWGPNAQLTLPHLRAKLCGLFCFLALMRPSDLIIPTLAHVAVPPEGDGILVCLLGFKNDYQGKGATVTIWRCSDALLDPVSCLQCWLERSRDLRGDAPEATKLIIKLRPPYDGVTAPTMSGILNSLIAEGGGDRTLLSARGFRRGGATTAIACEVMPDKILHLGRWASPNVFHRNYVQIIHRGNSG
jgi:hypothetical protein